MFIDLSQIKPGEIFPGTQIRAPHGNHLMLSYIEIEQGSAVPIHSHPHEQGGVVLEGKLKLTIGDETRILEPGSLYLIPSNTPHGAAAVDGRVVALDVFSPVRQDYASFGPHVQAD